MKTNKMSERLTLRLKEEQREELERVSEKEERSTSSIIRKAVDEYLKKQK